jgi:signal transduction histidine kinase
MGRLFWKFFLFFWLAQVVTLFGVGVTIWFLRPEMQARLEPPPPPSHPPFPGFNHPPPANDMGTPPPHGPHFKGPPPPGMLMQLPLLPLLAGSLVSLIFAAWLAWYFARPIRSLRQAFKSAAAGNLDTRIGQTMGQRRDELADLGIEFDRMAERLQGLVEGQRRLLHDVSHELRSPLARLQAAADLLRQQPERSAEFAERIERDTGRMDHLVGELLTLARLDTGIIGNLAEAVDLSEIINDIADDARFECEREHCHVDSAIEESLQVTGNRALIHRAIENIVRNALRHSPAGGGIGISAKLQPAANGGQVCIDITDAGSGVPESDLEAIFQPFFRSANSDNFAGYGLGLAISQRVVNAHGGRISARNRKAGGLQVTLVLPMSPTRQ